MTHEAEAMLQEMERLRAEVAALRAEVAEHRAARGLEAPAGWLPSEDALWERPVGDGSRLLVADHPCPRLWLWTWWARGGERAEGTAETCLGAVAAAEAALVAKGGT